MGSREAYLEGKPLFTYNRRSPSAQSYGAHLCPDTVHNRPPAWVLLGRSERMPRSNVPPPKYKLGDLMGVQSQECTTAPQYSILGRDALKLPKTAGPGPGRYGNVPLEVYLRREPTPQIMSGKGRKVGTGTPAPKYLYTTNEKNEPPAYSFGVKHTPYQRPLYTTEDLQPFYGF